jgi:sugar (pentulose or hexulose) kinase
LPDPGLVVAIDIGTTGVKVAAVDAAAVSHAAAAREYPTRSPRPGWAVQDPDAVVGMSAAAVAEVMAEVRGAGSRVAGVAFSAAFLGLTQRHSRAHLTRAALEGVYLQLALVLEAMAAAGLQLTELRATGGFARSPFWRQLLADVLGTTIGFPASEQGSALGAALLGHVGLGHLRSVADAAALVQVTEVVHPDREAARFYQRLLPAFAATASAVQDLNAWRFDVAPDDATLVATGQAGKEDLS